jgi:hypothetical protein
MKNLLKKISLFLLLILSLLLIKSCDDDESTSISEQTLEARFTRTKEKKTITFINISENATSYLWNFGDGTTSKLINPVKKFTNGSYTVTLTASNANEDSSVFEDSFIIDGCVDETTENTNPANGNLNFSFFNENGDGGFGGFGNIGVGIVTNPVLDALNSSCNVVQYNKVSGCETWSGAGFELNTPLNFATMTNKVFKLKVLAETQLTDVTLLLEFRPFPNNTPFQQRVASITKAGEWQELTFDFSNINSGTFKNMIIYFDRGAACDGDVYYFDDLTQ